MRLLVKSCEVLNCTFFWRGFIPYQIKCNPHGYYASHKHLNQRCESTTVPSIISLLLYNHNISFPTTTYTCLFPHVEKEYHYLLAYLLPSFILLFIISRAISARTLIQPGHIQSLSFLSCSGWVISLNLVILTLTIYTCQNYIKHLMTVALTIYLSHLQPSP